MTSGKAVALSAVAAGLAVAQSAKAEQRAPTNLQLILVLGLPNLPQRGQVTEMDRYLDPHVLLMNKGFGWSRSIDPEEWTEEELRNVEMAAVFGNTVAEGRPNIQLGLIPAAFGGESLDDWMPGTELYQLAVERTKIAQKDGTLVGILWYQGATKEDPKNADAYAKRFSAMITQLRADLKVKYVPVIVGEFKPGAKGEDLATPLSQVPQEVIPCMFVSSEGLGLGPDGRVDSPTMWNFSERYVRLWMDLAQP